MALWVGRVHAFGVQIICTKQENQTQRPQKVNVWAGMMGHRILGPSTPMTYFFNEKSSMLIGPTLSSVWDRDSENEICNIKPNVI